MPYVPEQRWNNPMSSAAIDGLVARLQLTPDDVVVDVGCGNGELLARIVEHHGCRGVGIDPDEDALAAARARTVDHREREEWVVGDVADVDLGAYHPRVIVCMGSTHAFGEPGKAWRATLDALGAALPSDGQALIGEGFWERTPPPEYLATTGIGSDDYATLASLAIDAESRGWLPLQLRAAEAADWDAFESTSWHGAETALLTDPSLAEVTERRRAWRRAYLQWGRGTLGFVTWLLRRDPG